MFVRILNKKMQKIEKNNENNYNQFKINQETLLA